jgi:hypothetical protein
MQMSFYTAYGNIMNIDRHSSFYKIVGFTCLVIALIGIGVAFKSVSLPADNHPYPMIRGGGLFLIIIGAGIILGAIVPKYTWHAFGVSAFVASTALTLMARPLTAPLGTPTRFQIGALVIAVIMEFVIISLLPRFFPPRNEHTFRLSILLIVGFHFLIMTPAFGPLITILGILTIVNTGLGIWKGSQIASSRIWGIDGILKLGIGAMMLCFPFIGL